MLSRDQILQAVDFKAIEIEVPEWGGSVRLRVLTGAERDQLEAEVTAAKGKGQLLANFRTRVAAMTICDERGVRMFSDRDVAALSAKSSLALEAIVDAALKLNRVRPEDVKELVGESAGDRSSASGAGSPSPSV